MDNLSFVKINLTKMGNSFVDLKYEPRHSSGIFRQASPRDLPAKGPVATAQEMPVSQASPRGSARLVFPGNRGARDFAPQRRGLKTGSMRNGSGLNGEALTCHAAASTRVKKRSRR